MSSPARSVRALSLRRATSSATTEPAPASSTIMSSTSDSSTSERSQRSENRGSRVVRLMKTSPWVAKASAAAAAGQPIGWSTGRSAWPDRASDVPVVR